MKSFFIKQIKAFSIGLIGIAAISSCTKNFEDLNTDPTGLTEAQLKADFQLLIAPIKAAQRNLVNATNWVYQLQQNLNSDVYSGYFMSPTPYNGNLNNLNYFMMDGWNHRVFYNAYGDFLPFLKTAAKNATLYASDNVYFPHTLGMNTVLKVIAMHKLADKMGPIIYSKLEVVNSDLSQDYDSQEEAYNHFFSDLDAAMDSLNKADSPADQAVMSQSDMIYGGNVARWKKLVNTLRLRLALRVVYANASKAKTEGEKALNPSNGGLLENSDDIALLKLGSAHPIYDIIHAWDDVRAGAPLVSYLKGYNDPRLSKYAVPATGTSMAGQYLGIRNGIQIAAKGDYAIFSKPDASAAAGNYFDKVNGMVKLASPAEAYFLKAEAALRGWANAGIAKENYEKGIAASFAEWGVTGDATYKENNSATAATYVDPQNAVNNVGAGSPYLSSIKIKYDDAGSFENRLEQIITQKWIANYPDGDEGWAEFRRTKYPKLYPVVINNSPFIGANAFINRMPIPNQDYRQNNPVGYQNAVATLSGPDNENTKLWWDKK